MSQDNPTHHFVYFIRQRRSVRIGYASDPLARMDELQTANASRLIFVGAVPGNRELERTLRNAFREYRLSGEWFRTDAYVMNIIQRLLAECGVPYIDLITKYHSTVKQHNARRKLRQSL